MTSNNQDDTNSLLYYTPYEDSSSESSEKNSIKENYETPKFVTQNDNDDLYFTAFDELSLTSTPREKNKIDQNNLSIDLKNDDIKFQTPLIKKQNFVFDL
jgi:hypothetical protein